MIDMFVVGGLVLTGVGLVGGLTFVAWVQATARW